ncbi:Hypothetical protein FKW44_014430 [Caligus rogercresseyi]|uniref:Uncharacterized protein n=1 Tax=Caligus rogercresseyi TaxID=217165 RepID=A0A7T8K0F2_CALRO|nr:Hypothetical protein FKW44_014430 [Caligus rogercresseyi]
MDGEADIGKKVGGLRSCASIECLLKAVSLCDPSLNFTSRSSVSESETFLP